MITPLDDSLIHQAPLPISQPASSDRNFYDRHWMNGFDADGEVWFQVALGAYPNRRVMDAHLSFVLGDTQHCLHASRRAPHDRSEAVVGPIGVEVVEPLRELRVRTSDDAQGIACDLTFRANSIPFREPDNVMVDDGRTVINSARYSQRGVWNGGITIDGRTLELRDAYAMRDRSWGIRPVGEPEGGAPSGTTAEPAIFLTWASLLFDDKWLYCTGYENAAGVPVQRTADLLELYAPDRIPDAVDARIVPMRTWSYEFDWFPGTRWVRGGRVFATDFDGHEHNASFEAFGRPFHMYGTGYQHPRWGHGRWQGELLVEREDLDLAAIDPLDFSYLHIAQRVRVRGGDSTGLGTFENLAIGRLPRYGFREFLDGAT